MAIKRTKVQKKNTRKDISLPDIKTEKDREKGRMGEVQALLYFMCSIMVVISLFSFDVTDVGINHKGAGDEISNVLGMAGAYISAFLIDWFGIASWYIPVILFTIGYHKSLGGESFSIFKVVGVFSSILVLSIIVSGMGVSLGEEKAGGFIGNSLYSFMAVWLGGVGVYIVLLCCIPILTKILLDVSLFNVIANVYAKIRYRFSKIFERDDPYSAVVPEPENTRYIPLTENEDGEILPPKKKLSLHKMFKGYFTAKNTDEKHDTIFDDLMEFSEYDAEHLQDNRSTLEDTLPTKYVGIADTGLVENKYTEAVGHVMTEEEKEDIAFSQLPEATLLEKAPSSIVSPEEQKRIQEVGERIIACLEEFKVKADLIGYTPGPVVTQYEIRPHAGVRVSKIKNLGDDIALKLEAISVRIQAPIPETDLIGIEVPNRKRASVYFQELINSEGFKNEESPLTLALGKNTAGVPFFADLAQMPHLLIAGATGAGKSVCLNSIILSILYKASPKEVQLLLIDPKRVELKTYQDLPHLVHPVVTDMEMARGALQWAVEEMERRYSMMEKMGSKDIVDFNKKVNRIVSANAERSEVLQEFPYLVILIDELADLILTATKEVETNLTRLSQLARASGIHLILATQRPSVDVVTALIKANFPSRIAFRVTSRHDSGTILDTVGAEKLLGKGDMLFKTTHIQRLHGAYVSTEEVEAVVDYWKSKEKPKYSVDFTQWQQEKALQNTVTGLFADENDPQYQEAIAFVCERGEASISSIQRRFRIGFNKAARYVEQMEQSGILENVGGTRRRVTRQTP